MSCERRNARASPNYLYHGQREFHERAYQDCRLIDRLPSPKKIQTLVTIWKQLWR